MVLYGKNMENELKKYISVITDFSKGEISVDEFERMYLKMVKEETFIFNDKIFKVIGTLFSDVDAYCGDADLRDEDDIDEAQLKERAEIALCKLLEF